MYRLFYIGIILVLLAHPLIASVLAASTTEMASSAPAAEAVQARRRGLEERITGKWNALIKRDFATAYSFTSPEFRKLYTLNAFKGKFGSKVDWQRIEVVDVDFKGDDAATVGITIHFKYSPPQAQEALDMKTYVKESWVRVDGKWWYLVED